jgi:hypothetical protein
MMFCQVADEIALIISGLDCADTGKLFTSAGDAFLTANDQPSCHPPAYRWLLLKQAYSRGDLNDFLGRSADFLTERHTDTQLLWYSTIIDLMMVCDRVNFVLFNQAKQEIMQDVMSSPQDLPSRFLPFFQVAETCQVA